MFFTLLFMTVLRMASEVLLSTEASLANRALQIFDVIFGVLSDRRGSPRLAFPSFKVRD